MKLSQLRVQQSARIVNYQSEEGVFFRGLLSLGLTLGQVVTIKRKMPFNGPLQLEIEGGFLALRRHEADLLQVEPLCDEKG